jgi:hypothetical protein
LLLALVQPLDHPQRPQYDQATYDLERAMSLGGGPLGNDDSTARFEKLAAEAEAQRAALMARAAGAPSSVGRLGAVIRRWREQGRLRHTDLLERKITARKNLRNFKQSTGDEPGQWMGPLAAAKRSAAISGLAQCWHLQRRKREGR